MSDGKCKEVTTEFVSLFYFLIVLTYTANMCHELVTSLPLDED